MSTAAESESFVLLRLGERRFAVAAVVISELVPPSRIFRFPHRTKELDGVILRRGRIVPVCDIAEKLVGSSLRYSRFYLIAQRRYSTQTEWIAIPVTGDCELISAEMIAAGSADLPHVAGWLSHEGDVIEVLDLAALTPGPRSVTVAEAALVAQEVRS
jgi:chemotaxis signal transduction protein